MGIITASVIVVFMANHGLVDGAEHGGKEHGGTTSTPEHGGTAATPATTPPTKAAATAEPSADKIRQQIRSYVQDHAGPDGNFTILDQETGDTRRLQFVRVHERVGKTGGLYYSCTDMRDVNTGQSLDLDFDVLASGVNLEVVDTRIHKVDGKARYTYDANDKRVPIPSEQR